jgi:uncharacterized membrane protein
MGIGSSNQYASLASTFQDLERIQFSKQLRENPDDYIAYVNERIGVLTDDIYTRKRNAFQKAHIDLARYMDMDHAANYFKTRSADVDRLTDSLMSNNNRFKNDIKHDKDITKRQFEINEWANYQKLEILFFLQVFFMSALTMAIVIYLSKNGMITNAMAGLLTGILLMIVLALGVYRYYYTRRTRDPRLWHRRYFGTATAPKRPTQCSPDGTLDVDLNAIVPEVVTQCADDAAKRFGAWQDNMEKEIAAFQETGATPSRISGKTSLGGMVCENLNQG